MAVAASSRLQAAPQYGADGWVGNFPCKGGGGPSKVKVGLFHPFFLRRGLRYTTLRFKKEAKHSRSKCKDGNLFGWALIVFNEWEMRTFNYRPKKVVARMNPKALQDGWIAAALEASRVEGGVDGPGKIKFKLQLAMDGSEL